MFNNNLETNIGRVAAIVAEGAMAFGPYRRGTARFFCAAALSCIAFAISLMAQQQQWRVEFTNPDSGIRIIETDFWNAGRMNSRYQEIGTDGRLLKDWTESFALHEVAYSGPAADYGGGLSWHGMCRPVVGKTPRTPVDALSDPIT